MGRKRGSNRGLKSLAKKMTPCITETFDEGTSKEEAFYRNLRDMVELMKGLALATAIIGAAHVVLGSSLPGSIRGIGAWLTTSTGVATGFAAALLYARPRFGIKGQKLKGILMRGFGLIAFLSAILVALALAGEINRLRPVSSTPQTCGMQTSG